VPRGHGSVRGEHAPVSHRLEVRIFQLEVLPTVELPLQQLEREEGGVAFVQVVDDACVIAQRLEQARTAHAQHDLLAQAIVLVAAVEGIGERAVPVAVFWQVRVEQEDRHFVSTHSLHHVLPRGHVHQSAFDGDHGTRVHRLQHLLGAPLHGRLSLDSGGVEVLHEVALPVQQRHRHQWHAKVRGRAKGVAGKHAESATVGGNRLLQADLHGEVGDGGSCSTERHEFLELYRKRTATPAPRTAGARDGHMNAMVVREFYPRSAGVQLTVLLPQSISEQHGHRERRKELLEAERSSGSHPQVPVYQASPGPPVLHDQT
jgi:hypothetical protein